MNTLRLPTDQELIDRVDSPGTEPAWEVAVWWQDGQLMIYTVRSDTYAGAKVLAREYAARIEARIPVRDIPISKVEVLDQPYQH